MTLRPLKSALFAAALAAPLAACMVGPTYRTPPSPVTPAFKEAEGWTPAQPSDAADRRDWWKVFNDPLLDDLEAKVAVSNQTLAAAEATYRQAHALVAQDRAALFPTLNIAFSDSATKSGGAGAIVTNGVSTSGPGGQVRSTYEPSIGASWAPDIWGQVRRQIQGAKAGAQASAATLAGAKLSAQTELAADYIQLRQLDEETRLLTATAAAYQRTLDITRNKYAAGVAARSDLLSAQSQLKTAQANLTDLAQQRARAEHAIAILTGAPPAALTIAPAPWSLKPPEIPATTPSVLLQRRPDIATAERQMAQANAQIGVAVSAYFPTLSLTGQGGYASSQLDQLFNASNSFWSVGAQVAEAVFDAGARRARVAGARAAYEQAVANYRQTVLTAFGQVEDNLAAQRVLAIEEGQRREAAEAADLAETIARNEYAAGTVDYTAVAAAQANALSARNSDLSVQAQRLTTAVDLIEALGGGWTTAALPRS